MTTDKATSKKKAAPKKKAAAKKKAATRKPVRRKTKGGAATGVENPKITQHRRNKNNLTDDEQRFADALLTNNEGKPATELILELRPDLKRSTARTKASNWMADPRIKDYMEKMRERVEESVEYDLVKWRKDLLEMLDVAMGRTSSLQIIEVLDSETKEVTDTKMRKVTSTDTKDAKALLELIAKQMKLLTDKIEHGADEQLRELMSKVRPTLGPPCTRGGADDE